MICFLSYARKDREREEGKRDPHFQTFVTQLHETVMKRGGVDDPIFIDEDAIEPGAEWPKALVNALRDCRVFAYLHSPNYFQRPYCGKEWRVFRQRMEAVNAVAVNASQLSPMIPIHWIPTDLAVKKIPDELTTVQFSMGGMDPRYVGSGMRRIAQTPDDPAFTDCVEKLARQILTCSRDAGLMPANEVADLATITPAFPLEEPVVRATPDSARQQNPAGIASRYAQFIFVAGSPEQLRAHRADVAAYEPTGNGLWKPFMSKAPDEVAALIAQGAADRTKLIFEQASVALDPVQFRTQLDQARTEGKAVVILIDAWTLRLEPYITILREFDQQPPYNCVPLIPWDMDDKETADAQEVLREVVNGAFPALLSSGKFRPHFESITTLDQLRGMLETSLTELKNVIIRVFKPARILGPAVAMPVIPSPNSVMRNA
jgi:FxsC-like protein